MQHPAIQGGREIPDDKKWSAQYLHLRYESSDEQFDLLIALLIRMDIILLSTRVEGTDSLAVRGSGNSEDHLRRRVARIRDATQAQCDNC